VGDAIEIWDVRMGHIAKYAIEGGVKGTTYIRGVFPHTNALQPGDISFRVYGTAR